MLGAVCCEEMFVTFKMVFVYVTLGTLAGIFGFPIAGGGQYQAAVPRGGAGNRAAGAAPGGFAWK